MTSAERATEKIRRSVSNDEKFYSSHQLRNQREVIRDAMLTAAECGTWLTLNELAALTRYEPASVSAQLRHLRLTENGGYVVEKRRRGPMIPRTPGVDRRGMIIWEYQISKG